MLRSTGLMFLIAACAFGQRAVDVRGTAGTAVFADESAQVHSAFGGSARVYLTSRLAIEPEVAYLHRNASHHDWLALTNISYDFRSLDKRVIPYVIGGAGYLWTVDEFPQGSFTFGSWIADGGGGAKIYLSRGVFVAPEFRVGSELHIRAGISLGYTFGR